jgi:hypothetical protein
LLSSPAPPLLHTPVSHHATPFASSAVPILVRTARQRRFPSGPLAAHFRRLPTFLAKGLGDVPFASHACPFAHTCVSSCHTARPLRRPITRPDGDKPSLSVRTPGCPLRRQRRWNLAQPFRPSTRPFSGPSFCTDLGLPNICSSTPGPVPGSAGRRQAVAFRPGPMLASGGCRRRRRGRIAGSPPCCPIVCSMVGV